MSDFSFTLPAESAAATPGASEGVGARIADHADQAVRRLAYQYRKPKIEALVRSFMGPVQVLEDVAWDMLTLRFVDTAEGAQLDLLGKIVGQPRLGFDDDGYRRLIRARVTANRSDGVIEDLITIATLVVDDVDADIEMEPQYPGTIVVRIGGVAVTDAVAEIAISLLRRGASGGVRILFEYSASVPGGTFAFDGGTGLGFGDVSVPATGGAFAAVTE